MTSNFHLSPFTPENFHRLSAVATAEPSDHRKFIDACESADVLWVIEQACDIDAISDDDVEADFAAVLDEYSGPVVIANRYEYAPSRVLKEVDPVAFREMRLEHADDSLVDHRYGYYKKEQLDELCHMDVLHALTSHWSHVYRLTDAETRDLLDTSSPREFLAALKRVWLLRQVRAAPAPWKAPNPLL